MKLPVHRWFRYPAGFSADWVRTEIIRQSAKHVFDPFAGSGTTLIAAENAGAQSFGQEAHPFIARVARAKLCWRSEIKEFEALAHRILQEAAYVTADRSFPALLTKCYDELSLNSLETLRRALLAQETTSSAWQLCWLAFVSIIRMSSHAGTAQWQYVLPNKRKASPKEPFSAYFRKVSEMASDMRALQSEICGYQPHLYQEDCRLEGAVPAEWADLIITSPPYINNYDYADATRLEMTMMGEIEGWKDLQGSVRTHLVRSCTQHVSAYASDVYQILKNPLLRPILDELEPTVMALDAEREMHGGKKNYHAMIVHYFLDLAQVWMQMRRISRSGSSVCFVIGDSAPYGIHVPVEQWLGRLALAAGFKSFEFSKFRDRNIKWKNRKHQIPLHEGHLWIHG